MYDCNPSAENVETGRSLDLSGQPAKLTACQILGMWEPVSPKQNKQKPKRETME